MSSCRAEILKYHEGGKVGTLLTKPLDGPETLSLAYTPGVALPVREIARSPESVFDCTAKRNLVAVVSDGTAILGLGDLGAAASIPVMEGKAVLFKAFGDVDAWPVPMDFCRQSGGRAGKTDPERVIDTVARLACMYGGINLEDIAAPACFEIERRLDEMLDIPVFHDDQWGTAVITLAGVLNYSLLADRKLADLRFVINGAGAAGIRIAEMLKDAGALSITMCDSKGVIHADRTDLNEMKRRYAVKSADRTLAEALRGAHVFVGVSAADCLPPEWIKDMAAYPAIFAMANPNPEIRPDQVAEIFGRKPYVMATGRSDYPNQINNVLGFPFLFRGALDMRAMTINMAMKKAAAQALAELARRSVPEEMKAIYKDSGLAFGPGYIVPKPFDRRLFTEVSLAVARAAVESGVARKAEALKDYSERLQQRLKTMWRK
ncbi:MAG: malic enzyme-like NAD(P)-binding protein [Kiritimatiellia bacterium]|jgi:malate dehydrogenase (oxaloacetate-decarboxylating)(NADP+)